MKKEKRNLFPNNKKNFFNAYECCKPQKRISQRNNALTSQAAFQAEIAISMKAKEKAGNRNE